MTWKVVANSDAGDATHHGGDSMDKISNTFNGVLDVDSVDINSSWKVRSGKHSFADSDNTHKFIILTGNLTADKNITIPSLGSDDTLLFQAFAQVITNKTVDVSLNTFTNILNANIGASAAIAYSKLNLATSIVNADIATAAAIAISKLGNSGGATGDVMYWSGTAWTRLAIGSAGQILAVASGLPSWINSSVGGGLTKVAISADYTLADSADIVEVTTGASNVNITLSTASAYTNKRRLIKKVDTGAGKVIIDGNASEPIDQDLTWTLYTVDEDVELYPDTVALKWHRIGV